MCAPHLSAGHLNSGPHIVPLTSALPSKPFPYPKTFDDFFPLYQNHLDNISVLRLTNLPIVLPLAGPELMSDAPVATEGNADAPAAAGPIQT